MAPLRRSAGSAIPELSGRSPRRSATETPRCALPPRRRSVRIGDAGATAPLAASLSDPDRATRKAAAEALDAVAWRPDRDAVDATYWAAKQAWDECARSALLPSARCVTRLQTRMPATAPPPPGRLARSATAPPPGLAAALADKNAAVRLAAARPSAPLATPAPSSLSILARGDTDREVRLAAAAALAQIGSAAVDPLAAALKGLRMPDRRADAARALVRYGDRAAVEPLTAALRDGVANVRQVVAGALGAIGTQAPSSPWSQLSRN